MTIDCQWISKNLEALFCDQLTADEDRLARGHIANCEHCRAEVQALIGIDSLIKKYFQQQLAFAQAPRRRRMSVAYGVAAAAVAVILLVVFVQRPAQVNTSIPAAATQLQPPPNISSVEPPAVPAKTDAVADSERAKPSVSSAESQPARPDAQATLRAAGSSGNTPEFLVIDPAGYSRTLEDYRGLVLLIGVWNSGQPEATANLEQLYKGFGSNKNLRFLGVSNERQSKPANTTFPVVYNQGSRLLGAAPGEFVLLDEAGSVRLRGSLVNDFEDLQKQLRGQ